MNRKQLIDHLRAGRPVNAKLVKEIVAELEKAQRLEDALRVIAEDETDYPRTVAKKALEAACPK